MPKLIELRNRFQGQGLVLIGVHSKKDAENMAAFVKEQGIDYPVAIDSEAKTVAAFHVDSFPDYYLIDRAGKLRFADLANSELERAITMLLGETAPAEAESTPWSEALADAAKRRKRVLATTIDKATQAEFRSATRKDRALTRKLSDEYVRYDLQRGDEPMPSGHPKSLDELGPALVIFDHQGLEVARLAWADLKAAEGLDVEKLRAFIEKYATPHPNAEDHYSAALVSANASNKRLLVHLGAPW